MEGRNDFLKVLAVVSMVIDHLGAFFFPDALWMRVAGRLAFPVFAWRLALGAEAASHLGRYLGRLLAFGLAAQWPYMQLTGEGDLNILFTLFFGLLMIAGRKAGSPFLTWVWVPAAMVFHVDYTYYGLIPYGLLTIYVFHVFRREPGKRNLWFGGLTLLVSLFAPTQIWSLAALPLLDRDWPVRVVLPRYFFYGFYPAHLAVLWVLTTAWGLNPLTAG